MFVFIDASSRPCQNIVPIKPSGHSLVFFECARCEGEEMTWRKGGCIERRGSSDPKWEKRRAPGSPLSPGGCYPIWEEMNRGPLAPYEVPVDRIFTEGAQRNRLCVNTNISDVSISLKRTCSYEAKSLKKVAQSPRSRLLPPDRIKQRDRDTGHDYKEKTKRRKREGLTCEPQMPRSGGTCFDLLPLGPRCKR
ncbi:unnamed protein product [Pleuronectes platessa]|uniref:Uncharacterized protein n=1 Tax=Pleuronectes platessa TaxID=8262 RepID=A0A9N7Y9U1_PLEPL|nr:unnamed protein product [Pleuronectes platessa]